ncbi:homeobox protein Hox-C12 isoform X2 [Equus caballus]|uniref:Homeobox C12 n=1 Tax=Equus caballus TaxID=9796 RepID=A0A9L0RWN6_HORSE
MGEHNLLNPGFVGPLVNIHTGDTFYFPNFRASGAQLPGLPSLSYPRRDNVCSLPWPSAEPCNGYPQPYLGSPVSLNPPFGRTCELARVEDSKGYYREPCAESGGGGLKREERGRDPGAGVGPGAALLPLEPSGPPALGFKYDYAAGGGGSDGGAGPPHDPPSCQSLESDSSSSLLNEGNKGAGGGDPGSLVSPLNPGGGLSASGAPWYPIHSRSRKKRKPYSKLQLAELEGEFLVNEFITRQRRRELSDRLNLSDQQVCCHPLFQPPRRLWTGSYKRVIES